VRVVESDVVVVMVALLEVQTKLIASSIPPNTKWVGKIQKQS
jgi:hypothetical protein